MLENLADDLEHRCDTCTSSNHRNLLHLALFGWILLANVLDFNHAAAVHVATSRTADLGESERGDGERSEGEIGEGEIGEGERGEERDNNMKKALRREMC